MIRWCAYCQRYQGELEPFDDYSLTHDICEQCSARRAFLSEEPPNLSSIRRFFMRVAACSTQPAVLASELVSEGTALGLEPIDLLLGIVQPVLRQIGDRWARAQATIAEEHRISSLCSTVIRLLSESDTSIAALRQTQRPTVLLAGAADNDHTLGLQILDVLLLKHHISVFTVYPSLPPDELVKLARLLQPRIVALSAALPEQLRSAVAVDACFADWPLGERPLVVVGGLAVRSEASLPQSASLLACRDLSTFLELAASPRGALPGRGAA